MALFYPPRESFDNLHQPPTKGERAILDFFHRNLNDDFEVYFQPFINGDRPDIVILKKNSGALIVEVKDWNLEHYDIDFSKREWLLKKNQQKIKSPLQQVANYKNNLFNLHISGLLQKSLLNESCHNLVQTMVYFHNEEEYDLHNFMLSKIKGKKEYKKYIEFVKSIFCWGRDSLYSRQMLSDLLTQTRLNNFNHYFTDDIYRSFKRYLKPPFHMIEEGIDIQYTKAQQVLLKSEIKPRRKIKGLAGSGKTFVLAKRAVNAYLRTNSKILILTYNLSLKNFIRDRISDVRENFPWTNFYIVNYHQFIKTEANNYGLQVKSLAPFKDIKFFNSVREKIEKYKVILIDEVQDFSTEWLSIIHTHFLEDEGEFVVFGDEKQNIYDQPLDENREPVTIGIRGDWNRSLKVSKRFTSNIGKLAKNFQETFMSEKYAIENNELQCSPVLDFENETIQYYNFGIESTTVDLFNKYKAIVLNDNLHPSNISILSSQIEVLCNLDFYIRNNLNEKTITTFETKEFKDRLVMESNNSQEVKNKIDQIRRFKKYHFWMKTGTTKLSSIHSFKGWESHTVFLIIEPNLEQEDYQSIELIYTALTRAQVNLYVFNMGNETYHQFFSKFI